MNGSPNREKHLFRTSHEPMFRRVFGELVSASEHGKSHLFFRKTKRASKPKGQHAYRRGNVLV